jgi:hypothetical protein
MTVCKSSLLVLPGGKDAKRDAGRPAAPATVTFVASENAMAARFYKRLSLCTRRVSAPRSCSVPQGRKQWFLSYPATLFRMA